MANIGLLMTGAVSGFGKGLQKGLENAQQYVSASALQQERDAMERKRLELTEGYAAQREQRGYAHGETLQRQGFEHTEKQQGKAFAHAEAMTGQEITSREGVAQQDRDMRKAQHASEFGIKEKELGLKGKELDVHMQYYKNMEKRYEAAKSQRAGLDPLMKQQADTLMESAKNALEAASKIDEQASKAVDPSRQEELAATSKKYRDHAERLEQMAHSVLGMSSPEKKPRAAVIDPDEVAPKGAPVPGETPNLPRMGNPDDIGNRLRGLLQ